MAGKKGMKIKKKPEDSPKHKEYYKQIVAEKYGYKYLVVWESEYKNNPEGTIKKCLQFLTS